MLFTCSIEFGLKSQISRCDGLCSDFFLSGRAAVHSYRCDRFVRNENSHQGVFVLEAKLGFGSCLLTYNCWIVDV